MIAELLADGIVETMRKSSGQMARRAAEFVAWAHDVSIPPEGVTIHTRDGAVFSGVFVVDRNRPVMAFVVRHQRSDVRVPHEPGLDPYDPDRPHGWRRPQPFRP